MWEEYVIDATMGVMDETFCYCPIEGEFPNKFSVVTGMNYLSFEPPHNAKLVGIVHQDGTEAVEQFCTENKPLLDKLKQYIKREGEK